MTSQNHYTLSTRNKRSNKYDKIFEYLKNHKNGQWKRMELLYLSGYIDEKTFDELERDPMTVYTKWGSYQTDQAKNGYLCYLTGTMRDLGILNYDKKTRLWSVGKNFEKYYYLNK